MKGYWTSFAKIGFPFSFGSPFWPFFNFTQQMQSLAPPTPQTETDFATTHNCAFWTALEGANHKHLNSLGDIIGAYIDRSGIHGFLLHHGTYTTIHIP